MRTGCDAETRIGMAGPRRLTAPSLAGVDGRSQRMSRRRRKLVRFAISEATAIVALIGLLVTGTSEPFATENLTLPFTIGVCIATVAVALIPIFFYALPRRTHRRYR